MFDTYSGLYIPSRWSCTDIAGAWRLHLHDNRCSSVSGARDTYIHSTVSWPSSFFYPDTLDWAWDLRKLMDTASPDAILVVSVHCMHEEAVLAWWKLGWLELPMPCTEKLVVGCVDVHCKVLLDDVCSLHVNGCSFLNRSADGSQDCLSSRKMSRQCYDLMIFNAPSFPQPAKALTVLHQLLACLNAHIEEHLLSNHVQSAYKRFHSTETALLKNSQWHNMQHGQWQSYCSHTIRSVSCFWYHWSFNPLRTTACTFWHFWYSLSNGSNHTFQTDSNACT